MSSDPRLTSTSGKQETRLGGSLPPQSIVYWSRIGFGVLGGAVYNLLDPAAEGFVIGTLGAVGIGVMLYVLSILVVKYIFAFGPDVLAGPRKHISIGMGSYIIWLIFTMILLNTILHPGPA